jgi:hypothetical protein
MSMQARETGHSAQAARDAILEQFRALGIPPIGGGSQEADGGEDGGEANPPAGTGGQPQGGGQPSGDNPSGGNPKPQAGDGDNDGGETISLEEARKLRSENRSLRTRLKTAEDKLQSSDDANLSELDRTVKDRDNWKGKYEALESSLKSDRVRAHAIEAASKIGAIEPTAVAKLIALGEVDFDNDLNPTNVNDLVAGIKKEHPRLFAATPGSGNGGERDQKPSGPNLFGVDRLASVYQKKQR